MILFLSWIICVLPLSLAIFIGRLFGYFLFYFIPIRRRVAYKNLQRIFRSTLSKKERIEIVRSCYVHLCLYGIECLRAPLMTGKLSSELVERIGFEQVDKALSNGHGIIAAIAHIGNIDMIGYSQSVRGYKINAIVKEIHWKPAHDFIERIRTTSGLRLIPPRRSQEQIKDALNRNEIVAVVMDQHMPKHRAIECDFFGHKAATSPAAVKFAIETGAAIIPVLIIRHGFSGNHTVICDKPLALEFPHPDLPENIKHNTERINYIFEAWIRKYPEQWLLFHQRWKI